MKLHSPETGGAFSVSEVLIAIGLIAVLSVFLLSGVLRTSERGKGTRCLAHLREIGIAVAAYANDHRMELPPGNEDGRTWFNLNNARAWLRVYGGQGDEEIVKPIIRCPLDSTKPPISDYRYYYSYSWNVELLLAYVEGAPAHDRTPVKLWEAERKILFVDGITQGENAQVTPKYPNAVTSKNTAQRISNRHFNGVHALLGSGSVLWLHREEALRPLWYTRP